MTSTVKKQFDTTGLHCPSCSKLVEMSLGDLVGVESATTDHQTGITEVVFDPTVVTTDAIIAQIVEAGYGATLIDD